MNPVAVKEVAEMRPLFNRVQIAERVLTKIVAAATAAPKTETGEAMVGVIRDGVILILDTISPDESAQRDPGRFQQGDDRQDEILWWMQENWNNKRSKHMVYDAPLQFLGDWHKQPGSMIHPSGGDFLSAQKWMRENQFPFLLVPIVTGVAAGKKFTQKAGLDMNTLLMEEDGFRLDMWVLTPESDDFERVMTTRAKKLPDIAPLPWYIEDPALFNQVVKHWQKRGYTVTMALWDADGVPPLEVCLMLKQPGSTVTTIIVLPHDYPMTKKPTQIRLAVQEGDTSDYDSFARAWEDSSPLPKGE